MQEELHYQISADDFTILWTKGPLRISACRILIQVMNRSHVAFSNFTSAKLPSYPTYAYPYLTLPGNFISSM